MVFGKIQSSVCTNKGCLPLPHLDNKEHFFFLTLTVLNNTSAARGSEQHLCLIGILCKIEIRPRSFQSLLLYYQESIIKTLKRGSVNRPRVNEIIRPRCLASGYTIFRTWNTSWSGHGVLSAYLRF